MKSKNGSSLVEVLIATIILGVLAIGGAAALFLPRATVQRQGEKHVALAEATRLMELMRSSSYATIYENTSNPYFIREENYPNGKLEKDNTPWTIPINGIEYPVEIQLQLFEETSPANSEYIDVTLTLQYRDNPDEFILINTSFTQAILNGGSL